MRAVKVGRGRLETVNRVLRGGNDRRVASSGSERRPYWCREARRTKGRTDRGVSRAQKGGTLFASKGKGGRKGADYRCDKRDDRLEGEGDEHTAEGEKCALLVRSIMGRERVKLVAPISLSLLTWNERGKGGVNRRIKWKRIA